MSDLRITTRPGASGAVLALTGDLDHDSAPGLREAVGHLALHPGEQLVLDLSGLAFCDSSGISAFIVARNKALGAQAGIALAGTPERILRVLRIVGLQQVFRLHPDARRAATAWPEPAESTP
ncbi:STAS domain-containing protein [Streptomyces sp. NBC_01497]|uniref:STAS domain-containing protein n=1 Tax=Streptomyces sp. NBC_01497 TaxID=2903885 RepID=UPI002E3166EA|nr:STAS domain-containing protein [Streptomyces sp. NBC_01497]